MLSHGLTQPFSDFFFVFKESYFFLPEIKNTVFTPIWYFNVFKKLFWRKFLIWTSLPLLVYNWIYVSRMKQHWVFTVLMKTYLIWKNFWWETLKPGQIDSIWTLRQHQESPGKTGTVGMFVVWHPFKNSMPKNQDP